MISIKRLGGSLGAEISGVDLAAELDAVTVDRLHQAFLDHQAVFFVDQQLGAGEMSDYVSRLGAPLVHPYLKGVYGHPEVHELRKQPEETVNFGNLWHTDFTNLERPSLANALYSIDVPSHGGDTLFMSMYAAFEALSPGVKGLLTGLDAIHGHSERYKQDLRDQRARAGAVTRDDDESESYAEAVDAEVVHPVVRVHPETGRQALYVNPGFTLRFDGMTARESKPILDFLYRHCERPEFGFRYSWRPGTLGLWDNRCTMHYASNDYQGQHRSMYRMVVLEPVRPRRSAD